MAFTLTKIVDTFTLQPGSTTVTFSVAAGTMPVIDNGTVAFLDSGDRMLWSAAANGTSLTSLLARDDAIPGGGTFAAIPSNGIRIAGGVVGFAGVNASSVLQGIYTVPAAGGSVTMLVDAAMTPPDEPAPATFSLSADFDLTASYMAFASSSKVYFMSSGGGTPKLMASPIAGSISMSGNRIAFMSGNALGHNKVFTFGLAGGTSAVAVQGGDATPGAPGFTFDDLTFASAVADGDVVAFYGASNPTVTPPFDSVNGIYAWNGTGLIRLADNSMPVPGGTGTFAGHGTSWGQISISNGVVAFLANDSAGKAGVYAVPATGGTIAKVLAVGDPVDGKTVTGIAMGNNALSGDQLVLNLTYGGAQGNAVFVVNGLSSLPCFAAGTRIATARGWKRVEDLRPGDRVRSAFGGTVPVIWVGRRVIDCLRHPAPARVMPVRLRTGALGPGMPARDLQLSPDHAVHLDGALVPARCLIDGDWVVQEWVREIEYVHVELPQHDVILAEGLPAESFLDTGNRASLMSDRDLAVLPADHAQRVWETHACAPQLTHGPRFAAALAQLAARREASTRAVSAAAPSPRP